MKKRLYRCCRRGHLALILSGAVSLSAVCAGTFNPLTGTLQNAIVIDDFDGTSLNTSIWETRGDNVSVADGYVTVSRNSGIKLKSDSFIDLPTVGQILVVETVVAGAWRSRPELVLANASRAGATVDRSVTPAGAAWAELSSQYAPAGTATAPNGATGGLWAQVTATGKTWVESVDDGERRKVLNDYPSLVSSTQNDWTTIRFVFDNSAGLRAVSMYYMAPDGTEFVPYLWDDGEGGMAVLATNAWTLTDPLSLALNQYEGGSAYLRMSSVQYEMITVPEPAVYSLLVGFGAVCVAFIHRRRRNERAG